MSCKLDEALKDIEALATKPGTKSIANSLLKIATEARALLSDGIEYQKGGNNKYDSALSDKIADKLKTLYSDIEVIYIKGQGKMRDVLEELSGGMVMFQLSNKRKQEFEAKLRKARPELDGTGIDNILKSIEEFSETEAKGNDKLMKKLELLALHWTLKGNLILPEDGGKVMQALKISEREKLDPFGYSNPNEINESFAKVEEKVKPINPDDYIGKGFSNKQEWADGVTVYDVDNNDTGREVSRAIIDTHFGKDANPWCLLARQNGSIEDTATFWYHNYPEEKKIAFHNGKLVAFYGGNQWWDRMDNNTDGVAIYTKSSKDDDGLTTITLKTISSNGVEDKGVVRFEKGNKNNGVYEEFEPTNYGYNNMNKTKEEYYDNGKLFQYYDFHRDGMRRLSIDVSQEFGSESSVIGDRIFYDNGDVSSVVKVAAGYTLEATRSSDGDTRFTLDYPRYNGPLVKLDQKTIDYMFANINNGNHPTESDMNNLVEFTLFRSYDVEPMDKLMLVIRMESSKFNWGSLYGEEIVSDDDIPFQKDEDVVKGAAILSKKKILIDIENRSTDTLAHEYAHFYIAGFRDTPIVQEAIKKWGSEEKLVQAIGEQVVKQKGEAYDWWKKFSEWIKDLFSSLDRASKEELVKLLTDAFLTTQDLKAQANAKKDIITETALDAIPDEGC